MLWDTDVTVRRIWMEISVPRLPLVQVEDFVSSLFATMFAALRATTTFQSVQGFLFASWLERLIDAQRTLTEYTFLYIPPSFWLFKNAQSTGHVFASPNFWAMHLFHTGAWTKGKVGHLVLAWVNEYQSHGLRAKPEPSYGKVNKCVTW